MRENVAFTGFSYTFTTAAPAVRNADLQSNNHTKSHGISHRDRGKMKGLFHKSFEEIRICDVYIVDWHIDLIFLDK